MSVHLTPTARPGRCVAGLPVQMYRCFFLSELTLRHLPRRQVREDGKDKNSVVSFTLTDEPQHIDLVASKNKEEVRVVIQSSDYMYFTDVLMCTVKR